MNGETGVWVTAIGLIVWAIYVDMRGPESSKAANWWARHARGGDALWMPVAIQAAAAAGYALLYWWTREWVDDRDPRWMLLPTLPAMLVYAPLAFAAMPSRYSGYRFWRSDLEEEGAVRDDARAIAWLGGPFALVGGMLVFFTIFEAFSI